jgi:hypothetical protein
MTARLIKETRELLVILIGTLVLIAVPFVLNGAHAAPFGVIAFALGCIVLGGCVFGNEFQHRTLPLLLSQPISRGALWRDKMLVLGTGIALGLAVLLVCQRRWSAGPEQAPWPVLALVALCAFCGAPYWTLVSRQPIVGMVCAAGFPASLLAVCALIGTWLGKDPPVEPIPAMVVLTLYCALVLWRGYARFKRLEVVDTVASDLSLPAGVQNALARPLARVAARFRGPYATLLKKELRLQQASFLVAGIFCFIAAIGFCVFLVYPPLGVGILGGDFATFMVVVPLVVGAIALAEERGWGLFEWHLSLPPSVSQQWSAKLWVTLPTSLGLGLLLPALMFLAGEALLPRDVPRAALPPLAHLAPWVFAQLLLTSVAVYAASFSRNTLRAIISALAILAVSYGVIALTAPLAASSKLTLIAIGLLPWGHSPLRVIYASLLLLLVMLQWFAWSNFRRADRPLRFVMSQLLLLLLTATMGWIASVAALQLTERMMR